MAKINKIRELYHDRYSMYFFVIKNFCRIAYLQSNNDDMRKNMAWDNWIQIHQSLLYKIYIERKYDLIHLVYENNEVVSLSCMEEYDDDTMIGGKRYFTLKEYRGANYFSKYMLDRQLDYCRRHGYKRYVISFCKYNKHLSDRRQGINFNPLPIFKDFKILEDDSIFIPDENGENQIIHYYDLGEISE